MCIYIHLYIHISMCVCVFMRVCVCVYVHIYACVSVRFSTFFPNVEKRDLRKKNWRVAYRLLPGCDPWTFSIVPTVSTAGLRLTWKTVSSNAYQYKQFYCSKTWLSNFRRARRLVFDDTRGLYQTVVNWIQHTFRTSRVLFCNSLGTTDILNLSAIWISHGPWNRKFSAPLSQSSKLENCVHPPKTDQNPGFCSEKSLPLERC